MPLFTNDLSGTWTPAFTFATPGDLSVVYTVQVGNYLKRGQWVMATWLATTSTFTYTTASGNFTITGLPFTSLTAASQVWIAPIRWQGITLATHTNMVARVGSNASSMLILANASAQSTTNITTVHVVTTSTVSIGGTMVYQAAA